MTFELAAGGVSGGRIAAFSKHVLRTCGNRLSVRNELKALSVVLAATDQAPNGGIKISLIIQQFQCAFGKNARIGR